METPTTIGQLLKKETMSATNSTNQTVRFNIGDVSEQTLFEFMIYQIANITGGEVLNKDKISKVVSWLKNGKKDLSLHIIRSQDDTGAFR